MEKVRLVSTSIYFLIFHLQLAIPIMPLTVKAHTNGLSATYRLPREKLRKETLWPHNFLREKWSNAPKHYI